MIIFNKGFGAVVLALILLEGCGGGAGSTTGGTASVVAITCNTAHYTSGAVSVPTSGDMATYAKTYSGNTGTFNTGAFTSDGGAATFVLNSIGSMTYNGTAQTVNSICKDNMLTMIYVEFGTTGAVDFMADGTFTGNLPDMTGVHSTVSASGTAPTVTGFTPATGAIGTTVTISGTNLGNFTPAPVVKFGTSVATVSSATATSVTVTVPAGLTAGNSTITLSNFDGTGVVTVGTFNVTASGGGSAVGTQMGGARQGVVPTLTAAVTTYASAASPSGITSDGINLYVASSAKILQIPIATGVVTTLAGSGSLGAVDATGTAASFNALAGVTTDGTNLYIADFGNRKIRQVVIATGVVTTLAGSGTASITDGTGTGASFKALGGISTDGTNLYLTDSNAIRKIVISTGVVATLAGSATGGSTDATGAAASFNAPWGITTDGTNLYVGDSGNGKVRKIVIATGVVTTLAGSGAVSSVDGTGTAASFTDPRGITSDGTNLYLTDTSKSTIRKIVIATGVVTTLAGSGAWSLTDGTGTAAAFFKPQEITTDGVSLYVADAFNSKVRKIQ
ncbi:MAG: IPT/TIG domain-containing protein [Nitrosomonadales bacterium]|nr:IPT/TIG domain-containing protein [Nitrosomonadales bacterium]